MLSKRPITMLDQASRALGWAISWQREPRFLMLRAHALRSAPGSGQAWRCAVQRSLGRRLLGQVFFSDCPYCGKE
jgi:hypothetical protein